jgi:hypothetical protein
MSASLLESIRILNQHTPPPSEDEMEDEEEVMGTGQVEEPELEAASEADIRAQKIQELLRRKAAALAAAPPAAGKGRSSSSKASASGPQWGHYWVSRFSADKPVHGEWFKDPHTGKIHVIRSDPSAITSAVSRHAKHPAAQIEWDEVTPRHLLHTEESKNEGPWTKTNRPQFLGDSTSVSWVMAEEATAHDTPQSELWPIASRNRWEEILKKAGITGEEKRKLTECATKSGARNVKCLNKERGNPYAGGVLECWVAWARFHASAAGEKDEESKTTPAAKASTAGAKRKRSSSSSDTEEASPMDTKWGGEALAELFVTIEADLVKKSAARKTLVSVELQLLQQRWMQPFSLPGKDMLAKWIAKQAGENFSIPQVGEFTERYMRRVWIMASSEGKQFTKALLDKYRKQEMQVPVLATGAEDDEGACSY